MFAFITQLKKVLPFVLIFGGFLLSYYLGYDSGQLKKQLEIDLLELKHEQLKSQANTQFALQLQAAQTELKSWQAKATQTSQALAEANQTIQRQAIETRKGIQDAITQDKKYAGSDCIDGLGVNGLRQYSQALGYPNTNR